MLNHMQRDHMKVNRKREDIIDSDYAKYEEHMHDIPSSSHSNLNESYIHYF